VSIFYDDPQLAWLVVNELDLIEPWERAVVELDTYDTIGEAAGYLVRRFDDEWPFIMRDRFPDVVRRVYGEGATVQRVEDAILLALLQREVRATPATSDPVILTHLHLSSQVAVDGRIPEDDDRTRAMLTAVEYRMPDLSAVSVRDLARLRLQDDLYDEIRGCLGALIDSVSAMSAPGSYQEYRAEVEARSDDLVRPTYERFRKLHRRAGIRSSIAGYFTGGLVSLGISALAAAVGGPFGFASGLAGDAAEQFAAKRVGRRRRDLEVACSVLLSVLPDEV
jgi:hypothetical protein